LQNKCATYSQVASVLYGTHFPHGESNPWHHHQFSYFLGVNAPLGDNLARTGTCKTIYTKLQKTNPPPFVVRHLVVVWIWKLLLTMDTLQKRCLIYFESCGTWLQHAVVRCLHMYMQTRKQTYINTKFNTCMCHPKEGASTHNYDRVYYHQRTQEKQTGTNSISEADIHTHTHSHTPVAHGHG
jgi:hypothetical protein